MWPQGFINEQATSSHSDPLLHVKCSSPFLYVFLSPVCRVSCFFVRLHCRCWIPIKETLQYDHASFHCIALLIKYRVIWEEWWGSLYDLQLKSTIYTISAI